MNNIGIGAASKDGSYLEIKDSIIKNAKVPTSTVPFKRSFQHNSLCGPRRLLALHFRGFEDQASCSRMLGGRATPAAWKTRPT